ncbi:MAG: hypothetical protein HLUCCA12_10245 [Rhodobacteraceae bacterium HLUCCA12]|nr:MAG: hypothetical protein HLUCCA12_10245 [Rhodobacteraceae bacterium HLUCCA12]
MARRDDRPGFLGYLFRLILILIILGGLGFLAFAYIGDLSVPMTTQDVPVDLGTDD